MAAILAAYVLLLVEAWRGRVRLRTMLTVSAVSLAVSVAGPVLLSRDVFSYAAYARIYALHHRNPYALAPASFPRDPFVAVTSTQWLHVRSAYGPAFTLVSAAIVRVLARSPGHTVLAFKAMAGVSVVVATACAAVAARAIRPDRAALAAGIVGLNPVVVVHTVGGGHVDGLIAGALAGAFALALAPPSSRSRLASFRPVGVTVLLTLACLIKVVMLPALVLWIWWRARTGRGHRRRFFAAHGAVSVGLAASVAAPFVAGGGAFALLASTGGVESWASPARLVARGAAAVADPLAGTAAATIAGDAVIAAFLATFVTLVWKVWRSGPAIGSGSPKPRLADALAGRWGLTLLLLALCLPFLLPWYAAWFLPFLALVGDDVLMWIGVAAAAALSLTLIPADPPRGVASWGVMLSAHYVAAPILLVLLAGVTGRVTRGRGSWSPASGREVPPPPDRDLR